jgi:PIN domain nuclease of toxin-antitoxin system
VRVLVDSHAVLWWLADDPRLSYRAEAAMTNPENSILVSTCVGYEIAYKQRRGRLPEFRDDLSGRLRREGFESLPISLDHALAAAHLPGPHRDPWDRIMIAQALAEGLQVVTVDKVFSDYGVPVIW